MKSYTKVGEVWFQVPCNEIYMIIKEGTCGYALCLLHKFSNEIGTIHYWNSEVDLLSTSNGYMPNEWKRII